MHGCASFGLGGGAFQGAVKGMGDDAAWPLYLLEQHLGSRGGLGGGNYGRKRLTRSLGGSRYGFRRCILRWRMGRVGRMCTVSAGRMDRGMAHRDR